VAGPYSPPPFGSYRFRADKNGAQYWSGASNHCALSGCLTATITISVTSGFLGGGKALAAPPWWAFARIAG
jgi:hypothetical protein